MFKYKQFFNLYLSIVIELHLEQTLCIISKQRERHFYNIVNMLEEWEKKNTFSPDINML